MASVAVARAPFGVLFGPLARRRTWLGGVYIGISTAIGLAEFIGIVVGLAVSVSLLVVIVGLPLLLGVLGVARSAAAADRHLANALLGTHIEAPAAHRRLTGSAWQRAIALLRARTTWRAVAWLILRLPLAMVGAIVALVPAYLTVALALAPFAGGLHNASTLLQAWALVGAAACAILTFHVVEGVAVVCGHIAAGLLGPSPREELARLQVRTERLGLRTELARELHDSVGHSVTAVVLQAAAARKVMDTDPAFAAGALEAIETLGRDALDELDRVLASLRDEDAPRRPPPGLADLDELVARTRAAGQPLTVDLNGDLAGVPAAVGREAYRIVQEGLANALRHASGAHTAVQLDRGEALLVVEIVNGHGVPMSGEGGRRNGGGYGLRGVAERVRTLGGSVSSGPTGDGGFRLRAELPLGRP